MSTNEMSSGGGQAAGAASGGGAWNWTALSKQAVARNSAHAAERQEQVSLHVKAAAAAVRRSAAPPTANKRPNVSAKPPSQAEKTAPLTHPDAETEKFSGLRVVDRAVPAADLATEMEGRTFIPLQQMDVVSRDTLSDESVDWVTIGVVARKTLSKASANGSSFMVWALSDLATTELAVFLFDSAYESHWRELEGSLVAVLNAPLMPASEKNKFALKVSKAEVIVKLGRAVDYGICKGMTSADVRCRLVVNTAKSQYCLHHIASSFMAAGKRRQQLNNSFSTFNKSIFSSNSQLKNISAGVYGVRPTQGSANAARGSGWQPIITKNSGSNNKRKRDTPGSYSNGAVLGVPTVISTTGSIVQRPTPKARNLSIGDATILAGLSSAPTTTSAGTPASAPRVSRGHKIIASMMASSGGKTATATLPRPAKVKKVNMMKFMSSGSVNDHAK